MTTVHRLAGEIAARLIHGALWDEREIAAYFHRSEEATRVGIIAYPDFPKPHIIEPHISNRKSGRQACLWSAEDVIAWARRKFINEEE